MVERLSWKKLVWELLFFYLLGSHSVGIWLHALVLAGRNLDPVNLAFS